MWSKGRLFTLLIYCLSTPSSPWFAGSAKVNVGPLNVSPLAADLMLGLVSGGQWRDVVDEGVSPFGSAGAWQGLVVLDVFPATDRCPAPQCGQLFWHHRGRVSGKLHQCGAPDTPVTGQAVGVCLWKSLHLSLGWRWGGSFLGFSVSALEGGAASGSAAAAVFRVLPTSSRQIPHCANSLF